MSVYNKLLKVTLKVTTKETEIPRALSWAYCLAAKKKNEVVSYE